MPEPSIDPLVEAAIQRLHRGFLGEQHRAALAGLLITLQRCVHEDTVMPSTVNATFYAAVHALGTDPTTKPNA